MTCEPAGLSLASEGEVIGPDQLFFRRALTVAEIEDLARFMLDDDLGDQP